MFKVVHRAVDVDFCKLIAVKMLMRLGALGVLQWREDLSCEVEFSSQLKQVTDTNGPI
jgi:hypothetical protein